MFFTEEAIGALARGCALFGGGGGGEPSAGRLMAAAALAEGLVAELVDVRELPDDGLVLPVAMIGAPTVGVEKLPRGDEGQRLKDRAEHLLGRQVVAFVSGELGGINGVVPVAWAARAGVPLVDGDLIGRAFPGVRYTVPALMGHRVNPMIMVDERGNVATFDVVDEGWADRFAMSTMLVSGALMGISMFPMTAGQAADGLIVRGSMTRAVEAGRVMLRHRDNPVAALATSVGGHAIFEGKLVDVDRRTDRGYTRGSATVQGLGGCAGRMMRLEFQNENLVAMVDGRAVATVPDIITVVDQHSGWPIVTEALRFGQRVGVVGVPCDPVWSTEAGLALAGPRAFGYELDFVPVGGGHATAR